MSKSLQLSGFGRGLAALMVGAALLVPATFMAATPAAAASSLTFKSGAGTLTGKWAYRSIGISGDPKVPLSKLSLGSSQFDLVEEGGKITGTRPAGKGKTYEVSGFVVYGSRRAPQVVLHSTSVVNGKTYEYDYFAYLMPAWSVGVAQPDTFMGTVVRTDPEVADGDPIVVSFIATREPEAAGASEATGLPVDSAKPVER